MVLRDVWDYSVYVQNIGPFTLFLYLFYITVQLTLKSLCMSVLYVYIMYW